MTELPTNDKWPRDRMLEVRGELFADQLSRQPHDLREAIDYGVDQAKKKGTVASVLRNAKESGTTVAVPRAGVADWEGQRALMADLDAAGAGYLPMTVDSLTRTLQFAEAERRLAESTSESSKLNGYPVVAHGVERTRQLIASFDKPAILRANATDLRVCADVGFAAGATAFVSGPMYSTLEYSKSVSLAESIPYWQYIYRLMGEYTEHGVPIADDSVGFAQSGTGSIPALMHVGTVLEALIMAAQGVKNIMLYSMLQGNIAQDVASCRAVEQLTQEYLKKCGFDDVDTFVASSDWNGAFPTARPDAYGLIAANVFAAAIAQVPLNYVKTIDEGRGVPSARSNAESIRVTKYIFELIRPQADALWTQEMDFELHLNLIEGRAIVDSVLDAGDGDPVVGSIKALETGLLDIPFSPNIHVRGDVLPIRDAWGAVRFLDSGGLAIPQEARDMEAERLRARASDISRLGYQDVVDDLQFLELPTPFELPSEVAHA